MHSKDINFNTTCNVILIKWYLFDCLNISKSKYYMVNVFIMSLQLYSVKIEKKNNY